VTFARLYVHWDRREIVMLARTPLLVALTLWLAGCGLTGNFRNDPGYVKFDALKRLASEREVALSLGPLPLKFARLVIDDEPELEPFLAELRAVRVYTYEHIRDVEGVVNRIDDLEGELVADGWLSVVTVRDGAERTSVLLRPGKGGVNHGLTVIVQDPSELVLVNLIGNVRLDFFAEYMAELDVDAPELEIDPETLQARDVGSTRP
jgi:hypothetical protein